MASSLGCTIMENKFRYLGVMVGAGMTRHKDWDDVPKGVLKVMESIRSNFFKGASMLEKKISWIAWDKGERILCLAIDDLGDSLSFLERLGGFASCLPLVEIDFNTFGVILRMGTRVLLPIRLPGSVKGFSWIEVFYVAWWFI
ncbi:hypothetical protein Tco_1044016 [Tanacetum coccineum]|uniref:Uncharacterized protein n=1 Tax=Tanacetum coccineum TaxID=301880 RepID=A0ABQ5GPZ9_9ASTR